MAMWSADQTEYEVRRKFQEVYESAFEKYRKEWEELKVRVEIAEKRAEKAELIAESVVTTLKALGMRGPTHG